MLLRIIDTWTQQRRQRLTLIALISQLIAFSVYLWLPSGIVSNEGPPDTNASVSFRIDYVATLPDDNSNVYFRDVAAARNCYIEGTDVSWTTSSGSDVCRCKADYYGSECGIPAAVWFRRNQSQGPLKPRKTPRRIVHAFNINHEIDFFHARLEELQDAVDVYIVCESNYTAHGDSKALSLLGRLQSGFLSNFHSKIIYVPLTDFPERGRSDGWFMDGYLRTYMGINGLDRIRGIRGDDLLLLLDADEFPSRAVLMFLKLYDGYAEPIRLAMRWSVFGFFWKRRTNIDTGIIDWIFQSARQEKEYAEQLQEVTAVSSMSMVRQVFSNDIFHIRNYGNDASDTFQDRLSRYSSAHHVAAWTIGTVYHYAGHHCSWCYSPEGIRTKLLSAHVDDRPRWGDDPEKIQLDYIRRLIREGEWFDGTHPFLSSSGSSGSNDTEEHYAPKYMAQHPELFGGILQRPSGDGSKV